MEARLNYVLLGSFCVIVLFDLAGFIMWMGKCDRNVRE